MPGEALLPFREAVIRNREHAEVASCFPGKEVSIRMNKSELGNIHEREAMRLRRLIASATTPALKARLIEEAEKHEELAEQLEGFKSTTEKQA